ncbi:hypothetical protein T03_5743 [Trichinella britovi]|uniref:Uncharacterized protein n=1 Tax=Trichinella britovi TaxID=45882 RepID=A0A0V1C3P8_TRIBR|nr:hypothetical protein T03_5743 [Trichinella britovi]
MPMIRSTGSVQKLLHNIARMIVVIIPYFCFGYKMLQLIKRLFQLNEDSQLPNSTRKKKDVD